MGGEIIGTRSCYPADRRAPFSPDVPFRLLRILLGRHPPSSIFGQGQCQTLIIYVLGFAEIERESERERGKLMRRAIVVWGGQFNREFSFFGNTQQSRQPISIQGSPCQTSFTTFSNSHVETAHACPRSSESCAIPIYITSCRKPSGRKRAVKAISRQLTPQMASFTQRTRDTSCSR